MRAGVQCRMRCSVPSWDRFYAMSGTNEAMSDTDLGQWLCDVRCRPSSWLCLLEMKYPVFTQDNGYQVMVAALVATLPFYIPIRLYGSKKKLGGILAIVLWVHYQMPGTDEVRFTTRGCFDMAADHQSAATARTRPDLVPGPHSICTTKSNACNRVHGTKRHAQVDVCDHDVTHCV